jgi:threonine synthase
VVFNTGEGLKTADAVADSAAPTHRIAASLRSARAAGLVS